MREDIRQRLIEVARRRRTTTYQELGEEFDIPAWWRQLGRLLGEISDYEIERGRPPLTAIVVRRDSGRPGSGFSGFMSGGFGWEHYRNMVWDYWSTH